MLAEDFEFGLLLDGQLVAAVPERSMERCGPVLSFPAPVRWNGWFLVTSRAAPPARDPIRFALHARAGAGAAWRPVGSSGYVRLLVSTALFHTPFATPAARGARADFDLYRLRLGSTLQSAAVSFALAGAGAARLGRLGKLVACAHFGAWVAIHAVRGGRYAAAGQWPAAAALAALGAMQLGNLLLVRREHWKRLAFW